MKKQPKFNTINLAEGLGRKCHETLFKIAELDIILWFVLEVGLWLKVVNFPWEFSEIERNYYKNFHGILW